MSKMVFGYLILISILTIFFFFFSFDWEDKSYTQDEVCQKYFPEYRISTLYYVVKHSFLCLI